MRIYRLTLTLLTLLSLAILNGCNDKQKQQTQHSSGFETPPPVQTVVQPDNRTDIPPERNHTSPTQTEKQEQGFLLSDPNGIQHRLLLEQNRLQVKDAAPVVILNFFTPWSVPCQAEAYHLSRLQEKYGSRIHIFGIMLHPDSYLGTMEDFIRDNNISYFIASGSDNDPAAAHIARMLNLPEMVPIPLTVIYAEGVYSRHYEGAVPVEMLEHDIQTLLEKGEK